jgi:hypothetical protein
VEIADMAAGKAAAPASTGSTVDSKYPPSPPAPHRGRVASTTRHYSYSTRQPNFPSALFPSPCALFHLHLPPADVNLKVLICRKSPESVHADDERTRKCK